VPKAYWAIVNGATGIIYWAWPAFQQEPDKLAAVQQVFTELKSLQGAIFGNAMDSMVAPPAGITTMSRFSLGSSYIISVNPNSTTVQGQFSVQGLAAGTPVNVLFENRTVTASAGGFTDAFPGVSRHVYSITPANTTLTSLITNKTGTAPART